MIVMNFPKSVPFWKTFANSLNYLADEYLKLLLKHNCGLPAE